MRKVFFIFFVLCFRTLTLHSQTISKIQVQSIPLSATSTIRMSCNEFDYDFNKLKKDTVLNNPDCIKKIEALLTKSKIDNDITIDVRGKLVIHCKNKKAKKICFDMFGDFYDGINYFKNKPLFDFLLENQIIEYYD